MFVNQQGVVKMTSYLHDMTFHRENGRTLLFKTFKYTDMYFCMSDFLTVPARYTCVYLTNKHGFDGNMAVYGLGSPS